MCLGIPGQIVEILDEDIYLAKAEVGGDRRQRGMCLGIPGQIVEILDEDIYLAKAEVGGVRRNINIGLVHHDEQRIDIGDWVLIHVGFAMSKLDEAEAHLALRALEQIGEEYEQELEELKASQIE